MPILTRYYDVADKTFEDISSFGTFIRNASFNANEEAQKSLPKDCTIAKTTWCVSGGSIKVNVHYEESLLNQIKTLDKTIKARIKTRNTYQEYAINAQSQIDKLQDERAELFKKST